MVSNGGGQHEVDPPAMLGVPTIASRFVTKTRALNGPVGIVGAGYIGHLFAQQFALAGYDVRAWSPTSVHTLHDRLRESVSTLAGIGAIDASALDDVLSRVSVHDDLRPAVAHCAA